MRRLLAVLALAALAACAPAAPPEAAPPAGGPGPYVVLVSFDGFRHDYLDRYDLPAFRRLAREGARARALRPVFTTKTFPNHYTIVTGLYAEDHGMVGNEMYDPVLNRSYRAGDRAATTDPRWYGGEPIWVTAEKQGVRAGTFFWPGSEAAIGGVRPSYWKAYDAKVPDRARVDTVLAWLRLPAAERPRLAVAYFSMVDDSAHAFGPDSPAAERAARAADAVLGRILDGLDRLPQRDSISVVVVSDHGLQTSDREHTAFLDDHLAPDSAVRVVAAGPYAQLFFHGDTAMMERAYAALRRMPNARVWKRAEIPERLRIRRSPRAGDVLLLMDEPWQVSPRRASFRPPPGRAMWGAHGWDPDVTAMHGILLARGPRVRPGSRLPTVENVNVYALLAGLLQVRPAPTAGSLEPFRPALR